MNKRQEHPIHKTLQAKSKFFCPAKWNELFLYLNHGNTNSCHHPIPHKIPAELLDDPFVLHNTPHKLKMQQLMMEGQRPEECHMCWHVEDSDPDVLSDRFHKSVDWKNDIPHLQVDSHYVPKFIEVVFDNTCNLNCSYCDPGQSTQWASKVQKQPLDLETDYRNLYNKIHIQNGVSDDLYFKAWLNWWPLIADQVRTLKISGGEPLISNNFWNFVNILIETQYPHLNFSINSNFSVNPDYIDRFSGLSKHFQKLNVSASIDATGSIAEYSRQNLNYELFLDNTHRFCTDSADNCFYKLQSTVNILNIFGLREKLQLHIDLRKRYGTKISDFYSTVVRFPEFQSISLLPDSIKKDQFDELDSWYNQNHKYLTESEKHLVKKTTSYLENSPERLYDLDTDKLLIDFKRFLIYSNKTSKLNYQNIYPQSFVQWVDNIKLDS